MTRILSPLALVATALSLFAGHTAAQVTTDCQPLNTTGCPADPAFGTDHMFVFNSTPSIDFWMTTAGSVQYSAENGAQFTINKQGDSPTIRSTFYIFFGRTEMMIKAAEGTGVISSVMFLSDDLDEIDLEFMGGNQSFVETNYFGKGRQDFNNAIYYPVDGGISNDFHNYTTVWTNESLIYYIDGTKVRTLLPAEANSTFNYPQTPMRISLGIWAGGDPTLPEGTREWAGGTTDYTKGPFNMYVKSARVTDYSTGKEYSYGDHTGSWESIKITAGNSTAVDTINAKPAETLADKWNNLSPVAHIAVYASAGGVGAIIAAVGLYYCIKQRKRGREENRLYEQRLASERLELEQFKKAGINPDSLQHESGADYNAREMNNLPPPTPDSIADEKERAWGAAALGGGVAAGAAGGVAAASAMRSPTYGSQQHSPTNDRGFNSNSNPHSPSYDSRFDSNNSDRMHSPAPPVSPMHSPIPGLPTPLSPTYGPGSHTSRSFSAPNAQMRASPGPQQGMGGGIMRTQSPAFAAPTPQRSYTASPNAGWRSASAGPGNGNGNGFTSPAPTYSSASNYGGNSNYGGSSNNYGGNPGYNSPRNNPYSGGQDNYGSRGAPGGGQGRGFDNNSWR
ncbi:hypothetical protein SBRCBS47491_006937 [Sporothrix bragantina]|uniref:chitinase n=1 Tax=Sporothrix bragantina TaxID=671064 RepID=A0ABP0C940_9PEZI